MKTLIIIKPDWVKNQNLLTELLHLVRKFNLKVLFSKEISLKEDFWRKFYISHAGTFYFEEMIRWMSSSASIFMIIDGDNAIDLVRWKIIGRNNSGLRSKYKISELKNVAHASDSEESATREMELIHNFCNYDARPFGTAFFIYYSF